MISKEYLKSLKVVHIALCLGLAFFILIASVLVMKNGAILVLDAELLASFKSVVFMAFLVLIPLAYYLHNQKLKKIRTLEEKTEPYRNSLIVKYSLIEGAGFLAGIFYMLSANEQILLIALMGLVVLAINYPSFDRLMRDVEQEINEQDEPTE